jgi:hypothetical protein
LQPYILVNLIFSNKKINSFKKKSFNCSDPDPPLVESESDDSEMEVADEDDEPSDTESDCPNSTQEKLTWNQV